MKNIKRININTISEFTEKIELAKKNFIPMLPFVKLPFHDFDIYKSYSDKGVYLIDYLEDEYCLYHLFHLTQGDDTLRATLILPSNWDKRFDIIEKSISNIKEWFLEEDSSSKFIIQSLEYGEIEYYPTLSHYLIPTIIRNGFTPKYRMYMRRDETSTINQLGSLDKGLIETTYSDKLLDNIIDFYYKNEATKNFQYFTNCTYEEFLDLHKEDFTRNNSKFIVTEKNEVVAGIITSIDQEKIWIDNFTVDPKYNSEKISEYLLNRTVSQLTKNNPKESLYIYLNRDCYEAVSACEKNGFVPFEFWTDMIFER